MFMSKLNSFVNITLVLEIVPFNYWEICFWPLGFCNSPLVLVGGRKLSRQGKALLRMSLCKWPKFAGHGKII